VATDEVTMVEGVDGNVAAEIVVQFDPEFFLKRQRVETRLRLAQGRDAFEEAVTEI
jgi:hypothetical protein